MKPSEDYNGAIEEEKHVKHKGNKQQNGKKDLML